MASDTPVFEGPDFGSIDDADADDDVDLANDVDLADDADLADESDDVGLDADETEDDVEGGNATGTGSDDDAGNRVSGGVARSVLEHVARSIVDDPDAVVVRADAGRNGTRFDLHVAPGDMGRIIGKRGRVAQALRVLVRSAAARDGSDASVDIVD
ncbi:MAG: KH domain-containing protein [Acidimicrobiales bacterium]